MGKTEIEGQKPYSKSDIEKGDIIIKVNQKQVSSTVELVQCVNNSAGESVEIIYVRDGEELQTKIEPIKTASDEYKLGLWVRDGAARNWYNDIL